MAPKIKVLIVEDESLMAMSISHALNKKGFETCLAATGYAAIERVECDSPDLIIMDINLADDMNGIEAAKRIRTRHQTPILFLSGYSRAKLSKQIKDITAATHLAKPFDHGEIAGIIETILENGNK